MNIHPLLVHFPIALLTVYSFMEFLRFKSLIKQEWWFYIKAAFVILGSLSTVPTVLAGKIAEGSTGDMNGLVELHSTWAQSASLIFAFLAFCYFVAVLNRNVILGFNPAKVFPSVWRFATKIEEAVLGSFLIFPIVLAGFSALTITGALGGSIVYGKNLDPFTVFISNLLAGN